MPAVSGAVIGFGRRVKHSSRDLVGSERGGRGRDVTKEVKRRAGNCQVSRSIQTKPRPGPVAGESRGWPRKRRDSKALARRKKLPLRASGGG